MSNQHHTGLEIAIVGMACRFPGAANWRDYWHNLVNGVESLGFLSGEELIKLGVDEKTISDKDFVNVRTLFENKDSFDSSFFNYRPGEARLLNPVHRVFHECVWTALEDAGYNPDQAKGPVGLYAGAKDDLNWKLYSMLRNRDEEIDEFTLHHINNRDYLATLIAYKLNLQGPAFSVNTGCSTSLVAINLACKSLLLGEIRMAIAGGALIDTRIQKGYIYREGIIDSKDGHCRAFDKDASGTTVGEGAGVIVLKRLADALKDGDHIYAVIKGIATNNDGQRKVGFTAPSVEGQVECIRKAQKFAKVEPGTIGYVETHGTGTRLGDPIEVEALNIAFGKNSPYKCPIGSVKSNFGHLDAAAGIAGLIKVALSLKYKKIPPSLNFTEANPEINFSEGPFYVNTELSEWQRVDNNPLRGAVSSFGIGGTNAHAILEEAPVVSDDRSIEQGFKLLAISAKTQKALRRYTDDLKNFLVKEPGINPDDMAYTLLTGRKHFEYRRAIVYRTTEELIGSLKKEQLRDHVIKSNGSDTVTVFMFSGAGSQYANMGKDLYESNPFFREEIDKGFLILEKLTGDNYKRILYYGSEDDARVNRMLHTQPVIFLFGHALARLMMHWGITPGYLVAHSIGEYISACISGVFTFEDALKLVVTRGQLMDRMPAGKMLSVAISEAGGRQYLNEKISLAAINGPDQIVLSGDVEAMDDLKKRFDEAEISCVMLHASQAGHSYRIDEITGDYAKVLATVKMHAPQLPFISNLTGKLISAEEATSAAYWCAHMRQTVRFSDGLKALLSLNRNFTFIELGGGHSLTSLVKQHLPVTSANTVLNVIRHPKEITDDNSYMLERLGQLWARGMSINWANYYSAEKRRRIPLPTYSFEPTKYPAEVDPFKVALAGSGSPMNPTLNQELKDWIYYPNWKSSVLIQEKNDAATGYLLFGLANAFNESLKAALTHNGSNSLVEVLMGKEYKKESENTYMVDPANPAHFTRLFSELQDKMAGVSTIIYCWSAAAGTEKFELHPANTEVNLVYFALANITRELLKSNALTNKQMTILTDALQKVSGNEDGAYVQALTLGLLNVLPQEYSVSCNNIDVDLKEDSSAGQVVDEINNLNKKDRIVAIRNKKRWVADYQKNSSAIPTGSVIRHGGVYLVTGGLGNVGFVLAKYLLEKYQAKLILTGRRELSTGAKDSIAAGRLAELRGLSADVLYYSMDVSDKAQLEKLSLQSKMDLGAIQGIIHAAGNTDKSCYELTEDITYEKAFAIFKPKVTGIEAIYSVFKDSGLDFVWITSSISSVLGGLSYGSYSAANLYLDYFVASKPGQLQNWKCVGLGEMLFTEEEARLESAMNRKALKPAEIAALFESSLSVKNTPVILETTIELSSRIHTTYSVKKEKYLDNEHQEDTTVEKAERPNLSSAYIAAETEPEQQLTAVFELFFGISGVGVEDSFFELGGDSLKAMMLLKRIRSKFNISIPLSVFFQGATIRQIALYIAEINALSQSTKRESKMII